MDEEEIKRIITSEKKKFFNLLQWLIRSFLLPVGGLTLATGRLTYFCIRDNLQEILPNSIAITLVSILGLILAIYGGFYIEFEDKPAQAGNKFRWTVKSMITLILIVCTALTLYVYVEYNVLYSAYVIAAFASFIGVFFAFNFDVILYNLRQRERRYRLLRDIHKELKRNLSKLVGKGYVLSKYMWDSGTSTGLIQNLDSNELEKLSDIYHNIDINNFEAKMCRQAGESFSSLPAGSSERSAAKRRWERLSSILINRESEIKKMIENLFKEDFWERSGVKEDEL